MINLDVVNIPKMINKAVVTIKYRTTNGLVMVNITHVKGDRFIGILPGDQNHR